MSNPLRHARKAARRRSVLKRAHHPVQDDCIFWADAAGKPAPPPARHAPSCIFEGGKDISECLICQIANVYAVRVWETGQPEIVHLDLHRADLIIMSDPSDGVTYYEGVPGAPPVLGRLRRGDDSSLFVLGPMIAGQCPYDDHATGPDDPTPAAPPASPFHR
jgi:hypothetical protein